MASALPVLASSLGAIPELVSTETGVLLPPGDVEAWAEALSQLRDSRYDQPLIARKAARFSLKAVGETLDLVYREALT